MAERGRCGNTPTIRENWKLLVEVGLEAYHFKVAHRNTIGPFFTDNQSTYQAFGPHISQCCCAHLLLRATHCGPPSERSRICCIRSYQQHNYWFSRTTLFGLARDRQDPTYRTEVSDIEAQGYENPDYWQRIMRSRKPPFARTSRLASTSKAGYQQNSRSASVFDALRAPWQYSIRLWTPISTALDVIPLQAPRPRLPLR